MGRIKDFMLPEPPKVEKKSEPPTDGRIDLENEYRRLMGSGWTKISALLGGKLEWFHALSAYRIMIEQNRVIINQNERVIKLLEKISEK